jgi:hypothetical protein
MRWKVSVFATVLSAVVGVLSALEMRDHVRFVEIITLFFGGAGIGAGITALVGARLTAPGPGGKRQSVVGRE